MSSDIFMPGAELDEAQDMLGFVRGFIDIGHHTVGFDAAFGPELSRGSARNFEDRRDDVTRRWSAMAPRTCRRRSRAPARTCR